MLRQALFCVAVPATVILLIQTVLILVGFGGGGGDIDLSGGVDLDTDFSGTGGEGLDFHDGLDIDLSGSDAASPHSDMSVASLFTVQGIVTFFAVFGWSGLMFSALGLWGWAVLGLALFCGCAGMYGVARIILLTSRLAQNGTLDVTRLLGETGAVYLTIPSKGTGKVMVQSAERFVEFDAVSEAEEDLRSGTTVRVIDVRRGDLLVVEKAD